MTAVEFVYEEAEAALRRRREGRHLGHEAENLSASLREFVSASWHVIERDTPFVPGWHIDAICEHLEAVSAGDIRRLIVMVPPGTMKSRTVSVMWPVWEWTHSPRIRYLTASYAQPLSTYLAVLSRDLIRSAWYQARWGDVFQLKSDQNLKMSYANDKGGARLATSVGGEGTGRHANRIIIDDPLNAQEAVSAAQLGAVINWHDGTISTRFADPATGSEVIIMQRLHERDLVGHVLERDTADQWTVLCLPEEYEPSHPFAWPDDPRKEEGDLLWPERMNAEVHEERKRSLGSFRAAGQLQQRPSSPQGEILRRRLWRYYDPALLSDVSLLPHFTRLVDSWDTSFKDKTTSDYVCGTLWGVHRADRYLLRITWERLSLTATCTALGDHHRYAVDNWPNAALTHLVENTANGPDVIATMKRQVGGVTAVPAKGDKVQRAIAASPELESGNVFLPGYYDPELEGCDTRTPAQMQAFIETCAKFPFDHHDDAVDSYSQAINWLRTRGTGAASISSPAGRMIGSPSSIPTGR